MQNDLAFQVLIALLRQRPHATPDELANAWLWVDRAVWTRQGEGLVPELPVLSAAGLDAAVLAPLRQGALPDAWTPWLVLEHGQLHLTPAGQEADLDELSAFLEGEIAGVPADPYALEDLPAALGEGLRQAGYQDGQTIRAVDLFRVMGFAESGVEALAEQWQEWREIEASLAKYR